MKDIYFICEYCNAKETQRPYRPTPSISYTEYLISSLQEAGFRVNVLSTAGLEERRYYSSLKIINTETETHYYFSSLLIFGKYWGYLINNIYITCQILLFLINHTNKNSTILIYHSRLLSRALSLFRKIVKRRYYYVVAEVFSAVYNKSEKDIVAECNSFKNALGYVFVNKLMPQLFDVKAPYIICHGNYKIKSCITGSNKGLDVRVVYAGKIAKSFINDAFIAVEVANFLSENYHVSILGYGDTNDINDLLKKIDETNRNEGHASVSYDGCLSGSEYDEYLSDCKFGLCTRGLSPNLSNYCFPSKTVVYLTHGILPICPSIETLVNSDIKDLLLFVDSKLSPRDIAKVIQDNSDSANYHNTTKMIKDLDVRFVHALKLMLS